MHEAQQSALMHTRGVTMARGDTIPRYSGDREKELWRQAVKSYAETGALHHRITPACHRAPLPSSEPKRPPALCPR